MAYSDSACSEAALLSQDPITAGTCFFYGETNAIGAWMGVCGAEANLNASSMPISMSASASGSVFSTMSTPANNSMSMSSTTVAAIGNATRTGMAGLTKTPGLQSSGTATSGVASLHEEDWATRMVFKALLMMGSTEVMWAFV